MTFSKQTVAAAMATTLPFFAAGEFYVTAPPNAAFACPAGQCDYQSYCVPVGTCQPNGCTTGKQMCKTTNAWSMCGSC